MRKSTPIANTLFALTSYFIALVLTVVGVRYFFPEADKFLPFGGLADLASRSEDMEIVTSFAAQSLVVNFDSVKLAFAIAGSIALMLPVSWVYFITTSSKQVDRSFAQTIVVLPVIVAAIATIVQYSLPLAFSLAGVVAAVRFRFSLEEPAHALYIFLAIAVGLGAGVSALEVSFVVTLGFVYLNLVLWRTDYGADLTTPFFSFLTGRGRDDQDL
ncbi:MAG: DUF4956 domain-containing protein [Pseudomonadota bacterium]